MVVVAAIKSSRRERGINSLQDRESCRHGCNQGGVAGVLWGAPAMARVGATRQFCRKPRTGTQETIMDGDAGKDPLHQNYHVGLRNMHALEQSAIELTERQTERLENYPDMKARLAAHRQESVEQARRLEQILQRHGTSPSTAKNTVTSVMGNVAAAMHTVASDEILKNTFANYAFEHQEIAAYTSLIAMAEMVGDSQSIPLLQQSLQEEQAMAKWIEDHIVPTTQRYMELARSGQQASV
jgi:ferritin-like metal-binding protein YciE